MKKAWLIGLQALGITAVAVVLGVSANLLRRDGIPLVADVPYEIFSQCKDSEAKSRALNAAGMCALLAKRTLYVDARPAEDFAASHVDDAINAPYSVLFGVSATDLETIRQAAAARRAESIVAYGTIVDPQAPQSSIDVGKSLAEQLSEAKLENVSHVEGGLEALKKAGVKVVLQPTVEAR